MLGPDSPENVRKVVAHAVEVFNDRIDQNMAVLASQVDEEIIRMLSEKISVLMLADLVNDTPEVPYISVWQGGQTAINQVYMSPKIVDLLGYTADEVKEIEFANLVGDQIVNCFEEEALYECRTVTKEKVAKDRKEEFLGNRLWKGFYRVKQKDGGPVWVMDKAALTKFVNEKGDNVVYVSEGILLEAGELMDQLKAGG